MAAYAYDEYVDLVTTTLSHYERRTWSELVQDLQNYHAMTRILQRNNVKQVTGKDYTFNIRMYSADQAEWEKLNTEAHPTTKDMHVTGTVPWRNCRTNASWEERILAANMGQPEQLVDLIASQKIDADFSMAERMEDGFFNGPTSASDDETAWGLPVYVPKGTGTTFSFENNDPDYVTGGAAGLASATYERWRSGYSTYTDISDADLFRKMREALTLTGFRPPVPGPYSNVEHKQVTQGANYGPLGPKCEIITVTDVLWPMEEMARAQNDNLRGDLDAYAGEVTFRRCPVTWSAWLDNNANSTLHGTNPVYGINWDTWEIPVLKGEFFRELPPMRLDNFPRTIVQWKYITLNYVCRDRRANWLLSQA